MQYEDQDDEPGAGGGVATAAESKPASARSSRTRRVPLTVTEAAATGNTMKLLVAMRERVAEAMTDERCHPRDLAALTRRLQDIAKDIEEIKQRQRRERESRNGGAGKGKDDDSWNDNI